MIDYREDNKWTVYVHIVPKAVSGYDWDKYYVGITSTHVNRRWGKNGNNYKLQLFGRAISKYKWENIKHEIIASNLTESEAKDFEKMLIKHLRSNECNYGYNLTEGGDGILGYKHSDEVKQKQSIRSAGENNPWYGKRLDFYYQSEETYQFDMNLNFVNKYPSRAEAGRCVGCTKANIMQVINNKRNCAGGFIWRSKYDVVEIDGTYIPINLREEKSKFNRIFQFNATNLKLVNIYNSVSETGYKKSTIYAACNGNNKTAFGYIWRYEKDVIEKDGIFFVVEK